MQNTQEVQEIEQGQEMQDVIIENIPDVKLPIEIYEVIWEYWGNKILPDRIIDNIFSIGECVVDTAVKNDIPSADIMRGILSGNFNKEGYPTNKIYRAIVERAENIGKTEELPEGYRKYYQEKNLNMLACLTKKEFKPRTQYSKSYFYENEKIGLMFEDINTIDLDVDVLMVADNLLNKLAANMPHREKDANIIDQARQIDFSVKEYLEKRQLKDRKTAVEKLNKAAKCLYALSIRVKKEDSSTTYARVLDAINIQEGESYVKNGKISVNFTMDYARFISNYGSILIMPDAIAQLNTKTYPHAYRIGRKLYLNYRENYGRDQATRLKVKTLLAVCPDLPSIEKTAKTRHYNRIMDPFERNLDALAEIGAIKGWHYCNSKGVPLTDEQLTDFNFYEWLEWLVEFFPADDYPEEMLERIAEKKRASHEKAEKRREQVQIKLALAEAKKSKKESV